MPYPEKLKKSLQKLAADEALIQRIYAGYDDLKDNSPKPVKTVFLRRAMAILDQNLSFEKRCEIIEPCACCLHGTREQSVKGFIQSIAGQRLPLAEKVRALRAARPFDNHTVLNEDGTISDGVYYQDGTGYRCACPGINHDPSDESISATYCLCYAGHFRHHLQNALQLKLRTQKIASSALASLGKKPRLQL
ncbi:hypothetical protein EDC14_10148 [Hydrogenispora ethanolica]|uniref:Uncharacterized protein n=1 Tax=Hydrogenispora ethanolica TaxID=1082276 RepID=A0A4R1RN42_HYDET|nr:hypothetical protein [Hydrogenispora ethanolica]TCL67320.1 hypothetical protein EDC14_10148 [Hydrogenispora ethanolica]